MIEEDEERAKWVLDSGGVGGEDLGLRVVGLGYGGQRGREFYAYSGGEALVGGYEEGSAFAAA